MNKPRTFYSIWESGYFREGTMAGLLLGAGLEEVLKPEDADILVFNGGADIGTSIYDELPVFRGIPHQRSHRDDEEIYLYEKYVGQKFLFGICRGAQLLNCLNGGSLWQDVDKHQRNHSMLDIRSGMVINVTSTHHQMMKPNTKMAEIIGISNESLRKDSEKQQWQATNMPKQIKDGEDIEVVWYPNTRSLCIQGHPEYVPGSAFAAWSLKLMNDKYNDQLACKVA